MRYELTPEEQVLIHQDQIDYDLREIARLEFELERTPEDERHLPRGATRAATRARIDALKAAHEDTKQRAKHHEAKAKKS